MFAKEKLTETEGLKLTNYILTIENLGMKLLILEHDKNELIGNIIKDHGLKEGKINFQSLEIEGDK